MQESARQHEHEREQQRKQQREHHPCLRLLLEERNYRPLNILAFVAIRRRALEQVASVGAAAEHHLQEEGRQQQGWQQQAQQHHQQQQPNAPENGVDLGQISYAQTP